MWRRFAAVAMSHLDTPGFIWMYCTRWWNQRLVIVSKFIQINAVPVSSISVPVVNLAHTGWYHVKPIEGYLSRRILHTARQVSLNRLDSIGVLAWRLYTAWSVTHQHSLSVVQFPTPVGFQHTKKFHRNCRGNSCEGADACATSASLQ